MQRSCFGDSVAVFFDFAAAFPSIEHALLFAYFQSLGWPQWLMRMISILYSGNTCDICMGKHVFLGFAITRVYVRVALFLLYYLL